MTIICATDFSTSAVRAARIAVRLCQRFKDDLQLVHVVEPPTVGYPELMMGPDALDKALAEAAEKGLKDAEQPLRETGVVVTSKVLFGHPAEALTQQATETKARMLVVGTHGRGTAGRFLLGSVAERAVMLASVPVLVVRDATDGFDEWVESGRALKVVGGIDTTAPSLRALDFIRGLREAGPCDTTLLHVYWPPEEYTRLGLHGPRDLFQEDPEVLRVIERDLRAKVGSLPGTGKVELRVRAHWGRPGDVLESEADAARADVIVVGTHQRHGLSRLWNASVAQSTLQASKRPVLCVPLASGAPGATAESAAAMPKLRRVLVATDFSEVANQAIPHAYALLAGRGGGLVDLCHVYERALPSPIYAYDSTKDALEPAQRADIEARLKALVPAEAESSGITTHVAVIDGGTPGDALLQAAARLGVDVLVLATHGRSGIGKAILGSVASHVVAKSEKPVYVVRGRQA